MDPRATPHVAEREVLNSLFRDDFKGRLQYGLPDPGGSAARSPPNRSRVAVFGFIMFAQELVTLGNIINLTRDSAPRRLTQDVCIYFNAGVLH